MSNPGAVSRLCGRPNNAGKSYLGTAAYAVWNAFPVRPFWWFIARKYPAESEQPFLFEEGSASTAGPQTFSELSDSVRHELEELVRRLLKEMPAALADQLQRCFATTLEELTRVGASEPLSLTVQQDRPLVNLEFVAKRNQLELKRRALDLSQVSVNRPVATRSHRVPRHFPLTEAFVRDLFPFLSSRAYYLPAARSGILQGHKALASSLLERLPLVGIERFDIPQLSGVVADFISNLLQLQPGRRRGPGLSAVQFLEEQLCKGALEISAADPKFLYPEIYYQMGDRTLPLHRTSSMVSEVAPLILFLKYLIKKGDLVILEEPEAHLHPDNQRLMARVVARLVRDGVRLLVTTHSDYFVHQISNLVRMKTIFELSKRRGYDEKESLAAEDLGAYLFRTDDASGGSVVEELKVTAEDGIPEEEFVRIAEGIYDEIIDLEEAKLSLR